jgi:glycosyltransferase involved in cell wall biosynthesis
MLSPSIDRARRQVLTCVEIPLHPMSMTIARDQSESATQEHVSNARLFVLSFARGYGGGERSIETVLPYLSRQVRLTIFAENERHISGLKSLGIADAEVVQMSSGNTLWALVRDCWTLFRRLVTDRPDAILVNQHKSAFVLALVSLFYLPRKASVGVYIRDFGFATLPFILRRLTRAKFFVPTAAILQNPRFEQVGLLRRSCSVIQNAVEIPVDSSNYDYQPEVVCSARLVPWKGVDLLVKAFAAVRQKVPTAGLTIVGEERDPVYVAELKRLVGSLGLRDGVKFLPFVADMGPIYRRGAVFVVPSLSTPPGPESFSRVTIEAWAHNRPVIAFDVGGPRFLIEDGFDGFLVPERDTQKLAERIVQLLSDRALCEEMGRRGRLKVATQFSPPAIAERLLKELLGTEDRKGIS